MQSKKSVTAGPPCAVVRGSTRVWRASRHHPRRGVAVAGDQRRPGRPARLPGQLHLRGRAESNARSRREGGHHRRPQLDAYVDMHIKGARAMPLRSVPDRAPEVRKTGLAAFYEPARTRWPVGPQHPLRAGLAQPSRPRRGTARLACQALSRRGKEHLRQSEPLSALARRADARGADAFEVARGAPDVREPRSSSPPTRVLLARLNYTSHIACNGVEEPKSVESYGLGLHVVFDGPDGPRTGFGSEPSDLSATGAVAHALDKARRAAVVDRSSSPWRGRPRRPAR